MSKNIRILMLAVVSFASIVFVAGCSSIKAQETVTGEWTASLVTEDSATKLHLNLIRRTEKGRKSSVDLNHDFSDLQGLSREQVINGGPVKFSLVREAGTIVCEGSFQNRTGSGTFRFTGNQSFVTAMKSRGFDFEHSASTFGPPEESKLFVATALNVTTALADDLLSMGFKNLTTEDLIKATIFKVDSKFAREMRDSGFPNLDLEDLVKARIFKIDSSFARQVSEMGFGKQSLEELVKLRIFKVTPEFIAEVGNEGLSNLSIEELVKLRIFKIDADFIRRARSEGVAVDVEALVRKRIGEGK